MTCSLRRCIAPLALAIVATAGGYAHAQRPDFSAPSAACEANRATRPELPPSQWPDRNFTACHILYTSVRREASGAGWRTDYPWGERHLADACSPS